MTRKDEEQSDEQDTLLALRSDTLGLARIRSLDLVFWRRLDKYVFHHVT